MWNPFSLVPAGMRPWLLVISIVLFLIANLFMKQLVATVRPPPLCLQFAWGEVRASTILEKWSDADKRAVRLNLSLDFALIVIYVTGIALACVLAAGALDVARWPCGGGAGGIFARAIIIAGLLDAVENVAQFLMLAGQQDATLASACCGLRQHQVLSRRRDYSLCPLWRHGVCLPLSRGSEMKAEHGPKKSVALMPLISLRLDHAPAAMMFSS